MEQVQLSLSDVQVANDTSNLSAICEENGSWRKFPLEVISELKTSNSSLNNRIENTENEIDTLQSQKEWKPLQVTWDTNYISVYGGNKSFYRYDGYSLELSLAFTLVTKTTINTGTTIGTLNNLPINIPYMTHILVWDATAMKCVKFEIDLNNNIKCEHSNSSTPTFCGGNSWFALNSHITIPVI